MNTNRMTCPECRGPVIVRLDGFPLNAMPGNQRLRLKCPLCGSGFYVGYVVESYHETAARGGQEETEAEARHPDDTASSQQSASSGIDRGASQPPSQGVDPDNKPVDDWNEDGEVERHDSSPDDDRSDSMNPNNEAYQAAMDNRSDQLNPNNPAYHSSRGG